MMSQPPLNGILNSLLLSMWLLFPLGAVAQQADPHEDPQVQELLLPFREDAKKWDEDVARLASGNLAEGGPNAVVLLGSSSFRLWEDAPQDLAPYKIVRRGYGSARYRDLAIHAPALLASLEFQAVFLFIANDITGKELDVTPETAGRLAEVVVRVVQHAQPKATVFVVAVTPTPSRFEYWSRIQQVNQQFQQLAQKYPKVRYLATESLFLDSRGQPREELFVEDRLHLNDDGYAIWSRLFLDALKEHSLKP
jgi:lysophospholipase L1-like esterase